MRVGGADARPCSLLRQALRAGVPGPYSLRSFLDGAPDMLNAHMALIATDSIRKVYKSGLSISPDLVEADTSLSRFVRCVLAAYVGSIRVHCEWGERGIPERSQFFHSPSRDQRLPGRARRRRGPNASSRTGCIAPSVG